MKCLKLYLIKISNKSLYLRFIKHKTFINSICPVCLGDGRDEGWKTAWPCIACNGDGHYHDNKYTQLELKTQAANTRLYNKRKQLVNTYGYAIGDLKYEKWLNKEIKKS